MVVSHKAKEDAAGGNMMNLRSFYRNNAEMLQLGCLTLSKWNGVDSTRKFTHTFIALLRINSISHKLKFLDFWICDVMVNRMVF